MALLDDLASALVTAGVGQVTSNETDWYIFKGYLQASPHRAICLYETPGPEPAQAWAIDYPSFQIRARGNPDDYEACRTKLAAAFTLLHDGNVAVGTDYVFIFAAHSGVISLGQDELRRPHIAQNYRVMKNR